MPVAFDFYTNLKLFTYLLFFFIFLGDSVVSLTSIFGFETVINKGPWRANNFVIFVLNTVILDSHSITLLLREII